ncbi:MAG: HetP family heterocyst commitment protein [Myxacorys chilensis ATA2-1-KO14]|jgi:hypothetical protein|nr:HetP family heterocyst commitment protein [Myxacorys chilensis ATA2-1-KO14]
MNPSNYYAQNSNSKTDKAMTPEQFTQVVDAILEGKYSWACILILRFAGYNPCHYIPRRTYNRLVKENLQEIRAKDQHQTDAAKSLRSHLHQTPDLAYLEVLDKQKTEIRGGHFEWWTNTDAPKYGSVLNCAQALERFGDYEARPSINSQGIYEPLEMPR